MNNTIVTEFVTAAGKTPPPEVEMKMTMEDATSPGYERVEYEFINKVKSGWNTGVNHELAMKIYERLCHCRDMEIELVWKRAVFMTAFLIACFAGYGGLIVAGLSRHFTSTAFYFVIASGCFVATLGFAVSILWIMMSKGSKAWYEHYEQALVAYSRKVFVGDYVEMFAHNWKSISGIERDKMSNCLCSVKGGRFSVSKISILIGILSAIAWIIITVSHIALIIAFGDKSWSFPCVASFISIAISVISMVVVSVASRHVAPTNYLEAVYDDLKVKTK